MKTRKFTILVTIVLLSLFVLTGCNKNEDNTNELPNCLISSPTNGQEIEKGETVTISVEASDSAGNIVEVRFFIDDIGKGTAKSFPFNYSWNTDSENIGNHNLKSTSIDNRGGSSSDEIIIEIIQGGNSPGASFSVSPTSGIVPLIVNFTDQSSNNPTNWQWDFGDGNTSTQQNPTYTYDIIGSYTITLISSNSYGDGTMIKPDYINTSNTGSFTDSRDNQTYNIVSIGTQTWFAENLNYETPNSWWYGNSSGNGDVYGRLYNWDAALTACPDGWHLPGDDEWKTLEIYMGMSPSVADQTAWRGTDEGKKLKSTSGWNSGGNGTDVVGFSAKGSGLYNIYGNFVSLGDLCAFWSATAFNVESSFSRSLTSSSGKINRFFNNKNNGFSIRCVKD